MLTKELHIDISKAMSICIKNGVKVYPIQSGRMFKIKVEISGEEPIVYDKEVSGSYLNKSVSTTYKHYAVKILKQQQDAESSK